MPLAAPVTAVAAPSIAVIGDHSGSRETGFFAILARAAQGPTWRRSRFGQSKRRL
jgi:hypothetical protein